MDAEREIAESSRKAGPKAPIPDLEQAIRLRQPGDARNAYEGFFLAMAHRQLGSKEDARKWYDQAVEWMDKNQPKNEELRRFRTEAEELLGLKKS